MEEINTALLDKGLQKSILLELDRMWPAPMIASALTATEGIPSDKAYSNIRYLELNGYIIIDRLHCIGSNHALENDLTLCITLAGQRLSRTF